MNNFVASAWNRRVIMIMVIVMSLVSFIPRVDAGFIPSGESTQYRQKDMATVQKALENKLIQERLRAYGYTDEEIKARLGQLSDEEVHQLASNIDSLMPAGDGFGVVIGVLVIVILVLVILQLMGKRVVVTN